MKLTPTVRYWAIFVIVTQVIIFIRHVLSVINSGRLIQALPGSLATISLAGFMLALILSDKQANRSPDQSTQKSGRLININIPDTLFGLFIRFILAILSALAVLAGFLLIGFTAVCGIPALRYGHSNEVAISMGALAVGIFLLLFAKTVFSILNREPDKNNSTNTPSQ